MNPRSHSPRSGGIEPDPEVNRLIDAAVDSRRPVLLAVAGGIGLAEAVALTTMVLTEPTPLPTMTAAALLTIAAAGLSWAVLAAWRLSRREVLLLPDRVAAGGLGLFWSSVATVGGTVIAVDRGQTTAAAAIAAAGVTVVALAGFLTAQAWSDRRRARARLAALTGAAAA